MTPAQAKTLRTLKAIENKTWAALTSASSTSTAHDACNILGADDKNVIAWNKASAAVNNFSATLPYGGR